MCCRLAMAIAAVCIAGALVSSNAAALLADPADWKNDGDAPLQGCGSVLPMCSADVAPAGGDGQVDATDLLAVMNSWGQVGPP